MLFAEIQGRHKNIEQIKALVASASIQSFLFVGVEGVGKRRFSHAMAQALLCSNQSQTGEACGICASCLYVSENNHPDLHWIDVDGKDKNIKVEHVRNAICNDVTLSSHINKNKVYIVDGDYLNEQSQNVLLKTLEEPLKNVYFIITISNVKKLLPTLLSRCVQVHIEGLKKDEVKEFIFYEQKEKNTRTQMEDSAKQLNSLELIYAYSRGVPQKIIDLIQDDTFWLIRKEVLEFCFELVNMNRAKLLTKGLDFFVQHKDINKTVFQCMLEWVRDLQLLTCGNEKQILNIDYLDKMNASIKKFKWTPNQLKNCGSLIQSVQNQLLFNANFEMSHVYFLLNMRKELDPPCEQLTKVAF